MSPYFTNQDRNWHAIYRSLTPKERAVIDRAYDAAAKVLSDSKLAAAGDDRAEALVASITRYFVQSKN